MESSTSLIRQMFTVKQEGNVDASTINILDNMTSSLSKVPGFVAPTWDDFPMFLKVTIQLRFYGWPFILVIGTFGNIMAAVVFSRGSMRASTSALIFRLLAISELIFLLVELGPYILDQYFSNEWLEEHAITCKITSFLTATMRNIAAWCLALVAIERLVGIVVPHKAKVWITRKRAKLTLAIMIIVMICINSLYFVMMKNYYIFFADKYRCDLVGTTPRWEHFVSVIWPWINFLAYLALPLFIMIFCNIVIIITLIRSARVRSEVTSHSNSNNKTSSMTTILLVVCVVYFTLSMPSCIQYLLGTQPGLMGTAVYFFGVTCQYLNHSCNFFLYCLSGARFRQELVAMCRCNKQRLSRRDQRSQQSRPSDRDIGDPCSSIAKTKN